MTSAATLHWQQYADSARRSLKTRTPACSTPTGVLTGRGVFSYELIEKWPRSRRGGVTTRPFGLGSHLSPGRLPFCAQ